MSGTKSYPSGESVVIKGSMVVTGYDAVNKSKKFGFNDELPPNPRGVYIGGESGSVYTLWVEESDGSLIPYFNIVPGVVHPIYPKRVINIESKRTNAINILIKY